MGLVSWLDWCGELGGEILFGCGVERGWSGAEWKGGAAWGMKKD